MQNGDKASPSISSAGRGLLVCLFALRFNVPVNNFSVMSGRSHRNLGMYFSGSKSVFAQGHNTAEVGIESPTSRPGVRDYH